MLGCRALCVESHADAEGAATGLVADAAANDTACIRQGSEDSAVAMEAAFKSAGVRVAADDAKRIAATLTKLALDPGEKGSRR